jgi:hypothetical protein
VVLGKILEINVVITAVNSNQLSLIAGNWLLISLEDSLVYVSRRRL